MTAPQPSAAEIQSTADLAPQSQSARQTWSTWQKVAVLAFALSPAALALVSARRALVLGTAAVTVVFAAVVLVKSVAIVASYLRRYTMHDKHETLLDLDDAALPVYSILIPLYKEPEMVSDLLATMGELDYPRHKLDIMFLLEADDPSTAEAFHRRDRDLRALGARVVVVPPGTPKTKPRACNHGLALARGELLVIYDAEDRPEPDQLKKAVVAFRALGPKTACLQAKLNYYNFSQNVLTRLFTLEYTTWFDIYLPGLHALGAPIPLGGTSNHFRIDVLRSLGGWDAYNVTEDCDLGIRLARGRWETRILDSTTWEEACSRIRPWLTQRSRWVKGYLQTFLVHTRSLPATLRDLGPRQAALMMVTVGGLVVTLVLTFPAVAMLVVWIVTFLRDPLWRPDPPLWAASVSLFIFAAYFVCVHMLGAYQRRRIALLPYGLLLPLYWALMSVGAVRGVLQLFTRPFHWEKTPHGLTPLAPAPAPVLARSPEIVAGDDGETALAPPPSTRLRQRPLGASRRRHMALGTAAVAVAIVVIPFVVLHGDAGGRVGDAKTGELKVDASWVGRKRIDVEVKLNQRAAPTAVIAYVKALDGEWYEHAVPDVIHKGNQLQLSVPLDEAWQPGQHALPWGPWCWRRIRELGVRVFGKSGHSAPTPEILRVDAQGTIAGRPVTFVLDASVPTRAETNQVHEVRFTVDREWSDPFDPDEVELWGVFEGPSGQPTRVPAFYDQGYRRRGDGQSKREILEAVGMPFWAVRFAASRPGTYRWHIEGRDRGGSLGRSGDRTLAIAPSGRPGYVHADVAGGRFAFDTGESYYPIAINLSSPGDGRAAKSYDFTVPDQDEGAVKMEAYLRRMHDAGISQARVWLAPWFGGLEWRADAVGYYGRGAYNLQNAWRIDQVMNTAEALGIHIELLLFPHGPYQPEFLEPWGHLPDSQWDENPYNVKNGGPVAEATDFMANAEARKGVHRYLRYLAARYGAYPALFGWVLWNEADTVTADVAKLADWHREMARALREIDLGRHIISTEFRVTGYAEVWSVPEIDYVQSEAYAHDRKPGLVARLDGVVEKLSSFEKPIVVEEYGGGWWGGEMSLMAQNIHDGLWAGWMKGLPSTPMAWWWNLIFEKHLDEYYRSFARYARGEDRHGQVWHEVTPRVIGSDRLRARASQGSDGAYVWIYDFATTERTEIPPYLLHHDGPPPPPAPPVPLQADLAGGQAPALFPEVRGAQLELRDLADGEYVVEAFDTWTPGPPATARISSRNHRALWPLPPMTRDLALKVRRVDETSRP